LKKQTERETERDVSENQALEELAGMSPATPTGVNFTGAFEKLAVDFKREENKSEEVRNGFRIGDFCPCVYPDALTSRILSRCWKQKPPAGKVIFKFPSNPTHSVILGFHCCDSAFQSATQASLEPAGS